jgi:hypothetical protein
VTEHLREEVGGRRRRVVPANAGGWYASDETHEGSRWFLGLATGRHHRPAFRLYSSELPRRRAGLPLRLPEKKEGGDVAARCHGVFERSPAIKARERVKSASGSWVAGLVEFSGGNRIEDEGNSMVAVVASGAVGEETDRQ